MQQILFQSEKMPEASQLDSYAGEQRKDPSLLPLIEYLMERNLPEDPQESRSVSVA